MKKQIQIYNKTTALHKIHIYKKDLTKNCRAITLLHFDNLIQIKCKTEKKSVYNGIVEQKLM